MLLAAGVHAACQSPVRPASLAPGALAQMAWADVAQQAQGTTVSFAMWAGDEARNRFFQDDVTRAMAVSPGISLRIVPMAETADLVNKLLNEKSAGAGGSIDVLWINGENFRTARQGGVLWGPFAEALPNVQHYDPAARASDFGTPTDGYEAPWEYSQFVFAYDTARVADPPRTLAGLERWIAAHPGRFTYPAIPDFTGSAFIRHVLFHQPGVGLAAFAGPFDEGVYARASTGTIAFLRDLRPFLWRRGETYPATPADLNRLFANGEIDFSMNYSPGFASERIAKGEFPATTRTFVFDEGTIANYNFLAIPFNAPNPAGALAVINALLSPAHAVAKLEALGGVLPFPADRLSAEERRTLAAMPPGPATLSFGELAAHRIGEADVEYLLRLERDWRREVLQR
jgi:putative spermidine/putrescine transport system substrate-binding protein